MLEAVARTIRKCNAELRDFDGMVIGWPTESVGDSNRLYYETLCVGICARELTYGGESRFLCWNYQIRLRKITPPIGHVSHSDKTQ